MRTRNDWIGWLWRHPGDFVVNVVGISSAISNIILAAITIFLFFQNRDLIRQNKVNTRRQHLGEKYEEALKLFSDTADTLKRWLNQYESSGGQIFPAASSSKEAILSQRERAIQMGIWLDLYPSEKVNPLIREWILLMSNILDLFNSSYDNAQTNSHGQLIALESDVLNIKKRVPVMISNMIDIQEKISNAMREQLEI